MEGIRKGNSVAYFDPNSGEVYVYAPAIPNTEEARKTVLHEVLGHKGLRNVTQEFD